MATKAELLARIAKLERILYYGFMSEQMYRAVVMVAKAEAARTGSVVKVVR